MYLNDQGHHLKKQLLEIDMDIDQHNQFFKLPQLVDLSAESTENYADHLIQNQQLRQKRAHFLQFTSELPPRDDLPFLRHGTALHRTPEVFGPKVGNLSQVVEL